MAPNNRIVRIERIDNGTTAGKEVLIDNYGRRWEKTDMNKETCGTGDIIAQIDSNGKLFY